MKYEGWLTNDETKGTVIGVNVNVKMAKYTSNF